MSITLRIILGPSYDDTAEQIESQLEPVGFLEVRLAAQIVRSHWRIERSEKLADPDHPEIDRIRYRAETSIRRNMAEIRQLQADRHLKAELNLDLPGITRVKEILQSSALSQQVLCKRQNSGQRTQSEPTISSVAEMETKIAAVITREEELQSANLKKQTHSGAAVGRNALCPCGSRLKYKRCCGKERHLS